MAASGQKQIALMVAGLMKKAANIPAEAHDAMLVLLELGTLDAEGSDPDGALKPHPDHPGYLHRNVAGKAIFIPFHLAKVSPDSDLLGEVIRISDMAQLGADNPICISGSTTFLGALKAVADLDFCEYYLLPPSDAADISATEALTAASGIADLPLVWAKFDDISHSAPWTCLVSIAEAFCETPGRLKLDFMSCGKLGPMPTTSVILPTRDGEDGSARESFAYQEAVIGSQRPLRALLGPAQFADYLSFLKDQAHHYVTESHAHAPYVVKALKRLLALKAALGDHEDVDVIVSRLNRPEIEEVVQRIRLDELLAMRPHLPVDAPPHFNDQIAALEKATLRASEQDVEDALAAARKLAMALLDDAEREFAEYA